MTLHVDLRSFIGACTLLEQLFPVTCRAGHCIVHHVSYDVDLLVGQLAIGQNTAVDSCVVIVKMSTAFQDVALRDASTFTIFK